MIKWQSTWTWLWPNHDTILVSVYMNKGTHKKPQSGWPVSHLRFKSGTYQMQFLVRTITPTFSVSQQCGSTGRTFRKWFSTAFLGTDFILHVQSQKASVLKMIILTNGHYMTTIKTNKCTIVIWCCLITSKSVHTDIIFIWLMIDYCMHHIKLYNQCNCTEMLTHCYFM